MRLMLLGTDRAIFTEGSAVRERIAQFGEQYTEALDSIVFSMKRHGIGSSQELAPRVHAHPTNSRSRLLYGWDAMRIARHLPRPDIISAQDPFETGLAALLIARYFRVPFMIEVHTDFLSPAFAKHSLLNWLRVRIAGFVLRHAAGGYAVSQAIKEKILVRYPSAPPLEVFPIYIDLRRFSMLGHASHPRFTTALLWVGRMEAEKDPNLALEAFIKARRLGNDVGLTFVGSGSLMNSLKLKAGREGVTEWVEFVGAVKDPLPYYAQADLLLVTSAYEGYGMVIVEALAAGVPVLSTDVGIAREAGAIVAEDYYAASLVRWLRGPRERGVLQLQSYEDERDYFSQVQRAHESIVQAYRA